MRRFRRVILVTGTPGVGKTSVSRLLAFKLDFVYINLGELVKREWLVSDVDKARETLIADLDRVSKRLQEIIKRSNQDILIDGHYSVDVVESKNVHIIFVLRRDPSELKRVMENRGFKEKKLWENLAAEILDVCLWEAVTACGSEKVCEIDVSGRRVEDVVEDLISVLDGRKECRVGIVDWLGKLDEEGKLPGFLKPF